MFQGARQEGSWGPGWWDHHHWTSHLLSQHLREKRRLYLVVTHVVLFMSRPLKISKSPGHILREKYGSIVISEGMFGMWVSARMTVTHVVPESKEQQVGLRLCCERDWGCQVVLRGDISVLWCCIRNPPLVFVLKTSHGCSCGVSSCVYNATVCLQGLGLRWDHYDVQGLHIGAWLDTCPSFAFPFLHRDRLGLSQGYSGSCANQGQDSRAWRFRRLQERIVEVASVLKLGPGARSSVTSDPLCGQQHHRAQLLTAGNPASWFQSVRERVSGYCDCHTEVWVWV